MPTYPYQFYRAKGKDAGVTGRVGCFTSAFFALRCYDQSLWGAGCQDMDFVRRLEARMMEWPELNSQRGSSFKEKCHNGGDQFFRLEFTIKDDSFSLPNHPEASSVYDAKSGDEAKIANCNLETLKHFRSWGRMDGANKVLGIQAHGKNPRAGRATDR